MSLRAKTLRRLAVLASACLAVAAIAAGVYVTKQRQAAHSLAEARTLGMAAYERKDYAGALEHLSRFVSKRKDQPEVLLAYARSRAALPMDRGQHLWEARDAFQTVLQRDPANAEAQGELLRLYPRIGYWTEALALADEVLARDPADVDALRARAESLAAQRKFPEAHKAAVALAERAPTDVAAHQLVLRLMFELKMPAADIRGHADALRAAHPDDPRFEFLSALSRQGDLKDATQWLVKAAARPAPDADFARLLATAMEQAGMFDQARQYLQAQATASGGDAKLLAVLCQRLWEDGRYAEVVERLKDLKATDSAADADLLALKALSRYQIAAAAPAAAPAAPAPAATSRPAVADAEADAIVDALAARAKDMTAQTWSRALTAKFRAPAADAAQLARALNEALAAGRDVGVVRFMLAEAYAEQGEAELALTNFRAATAAMPSWFQPRARASQVLLATGRTQAAVDEGLAGVRRAPNAVAANVTYALALFAKYNENPAPADAQQLLKYVEAIQKSAGEFGQPQTLPVYVTLLARTGRADDATAAVRKALANPRPLPGDVAARLVDACRREKLAVADEVIAAATAGRGDTPAGALAAAAQVAVAGRPADGLAQLQAAAAKAGNTTPWQLAVARYRETTRDPKAIDAWVALGDANPDDLQVQSAALAAPSRERDRAFWARTIERVRKLTGDAGNLWKLERARYVLAAPEAPAGAVDRELAGVLVDLRDIVKASPDLSEPRVLLAAALMKGTPPAVDAAVNELQAAANLRPADAGIGLRLYELLKSQGRAPEAKAALERLAAAKALAPDVRLRVAAALADQGELQKAIGLIRPATSNDLSDPARDVLLARLYRKAGRGDDGAVLLAKWQQAPDPLDPALIAGAADFFADIKRPETAGQFLARLGKNPGLRPGQRELVLAAYEEQHGSRELAARHYADATAAAPGEAAAWRSRAAFLVRANRAPEAADVAAQGLTNVPGDADLQVLFAQAQATAGGGRGAGTDLTPLIDALSKDPANAAVVEALKVLNGRPEAARDETTLAQLRGVADRYPQYLGLQVLVARNYLALGKATQGVEVAQRAAQSYPGSAAAARVLAQAYEAANRPNDQLATARRYRELSLEDPRDADAAIARAHLAMNRPTDAVAQLAAYTDAIRKSPAATPELTAAWARAQVASGQAPAAAELLRPLADKSGPWLQVWLELAAAHKTAAAAAAWVEQIVPAVANAPAEQLALGTAWLKIGDQFNDRPAMERARAIGQKLAARPGATTGEHRLFAYACRSLGDYAAAEEAFRGLLAARPDQPDAQNNLAYLLLSRDGQLEEARQLATAAVAASPQTASYHDTLARVLAKLGDHPGAIKAFDAALAADARSLEAMIGKATSLLASGDKDAATALVGQVDLALRSSGPLPADMRRELDAVRQGVQNAPASSSVRSE